VVVLPRTSPPRSLLTCLGAKGAESNDRTVANLASSKESATYRREADIGRQVNTRGYSSSPMDEQGQKQGILFFFPL
jgi:hypothetical protein